MKNFKNGEIVWDKTNRCYGVVLNNFGNKEPEIRLDSDRMQPVECLHKLGSKSDTGTKKELTECIHAYQRLRTYWPGKYESLIY
jgi:hypothetical protein